MNDRERAPNKSRKAFISTFTLLILFVAVETFASFRILLKLRLYAAMKAVREAGYPVTCDELDAWYSIPDDVENAADSFFDAFACFKKWDEAKRESLPLVGLADLPTRTEPLSDEIRTLLTEYVADHNETLALLHEAALIEHCRYPVNFTADVGTMQPHFRDLRWACFLLNLESFLHVENGEVEAARCSVLSGFGLTLSLTKEPLLTSQLVRMGSTTRHISTLEHLINRVELTDEQLNELYQCLGKVERAADLSCAFAGFRCMVLRELRTATSVDPSYVHYLLLLLPKSTAFLFPATGFMDMSAVTFLDIMNDYMEALQLSYPQRLKASDAIEARAESVSYIHALAYAVVPGLSRTITIETRVIAHLRTARAGLAIQRYRLAKGELPDMLAELVPDYFDTVPKDPFDGNELRYKKRGTGFVIYSIGEDLSDDGGTEKPKYEERKSHPNWDVTFIVER
jgi:hypothetical protein